MWFLSNFPAYELDPSFHQPTGRESIVEKWIIHKLNLTAAEVDKSLSERNFMAVTSSLYSLWLYEFCDVFIVRVAPHQLELSRSQLIRPYWSS